MIFRYSDVRELKDFLIRKNIFNCYIVVNDQTQHGGCIQNFKCFFESANKNNLPVKMTFDIGNWYYSGESAQDAIDSLKSNVVYLHLKHVQEQENNLITLPLPTNERADWRGMLEQFPNGLNRALEIPIQTME